MGNLCIKNNYVNDKNYVKFNPKFSHCIKCGVHFRLPDRFNYPRKSCSIHNFKKGVCIYCNSKDKESKCYHVPKTECIIM